jgi:hypothetical protein
MGASVVVLIAGETNLFSKINKEISQLFSIKNCERTEDFNSFFSCKKGLYREGKTRNLSNFNLAKKLPSTSSRLPCFPVTIKKTSRLPVPPGNNQKSTASNPYFTNKKSASIFAVQHKKTSNEKDTFCCCSFYRSGG